jgi:hypothetical protein
MAIMAKMAKQEKTLIVPINPKILTVISKERMGVMGEMEVMVGARR